MPKMTQIDYCRFESPELQQQEIAYFQNADGTCSGKCLQCFEVDPLTGMLKQHSLSVVEVSEPYTMPPEWELNPDLRCVETFDGPCLLGSERGVRPSCSHPQDQASITDPEFSPTPKPGPNGEQVCNTDCKSESNFRSCEMGFAVCHKFSKCSDGALDPCVPEWCGLCG